MACDAITPAVLLALNYLSAQTVLIRSDKYFLCDETRHEDLVRYCEAESSLRSKNRKKGTRDSCSLERKLPHFTIPRFTGGRVDGHEWVKKVVRVFKNYGIPQFLTDHAYAAYYTSWSTAFAARILDSLVESDIMSFLSEKYKNETNTFVVWEKVTEHLSSSDLSMSRIMTYWSTFMGLRCQNIEEFLSFYSRVTKVLDKLTESNSTAVKDDVFLRAFLARAISCEELQTEAKALLQDGKGTATEILEKILVDYRVQMTGEELRDGKPTAKLRRAESGTVRLIKGTDKVGLAKLPNNKGNLIPHSYYLQFKDWFEVMRIPEGDRTPSDISKIAGFKWKHTKPKDSNDNRRNGQIVGYGDRVDRNRNQGRGGGSRASGSSRSRRARGHRRSRSPSYSSDYSSDSHRHHRRDRKSRRAARSRSERILRSYSRSRSRSPRRGRSNERSASRGDSKPAASSDGTSVSRRRVMFGGKK